MKGVPALLCAAAVVSAQIFYGGLLRPVFALPAMLLVGIAAIFAALAGAMEPAKSAPRALPTTLVILLAGWLCFRASQSPPDAESAAMVRLVLGCTAAFLAFAVGSTTPSARLAFLVVILAAGVAQAAMGTYQFLARPGGMPLGWFSEQLRIWYDWRLDGFRAHGFFINGNHLAWVLNIAGLNALALACWSRWPAWGKVLAVYAAAVCFAGCLLTLSRGGFLGLCGGFAVFLLASAIAFARGAAGRRIVAAIVLTGVIAVTGLGAWLVFSENPRVQARLDSLTRDVYRTAVFDVASRRFQETPLTGGGVGAFREAARQYRTLWLDADDMFAHNDWAQLASDFGYPAVALAALALAALLAAGLAAVSGPLAARMREGGLGLSNAVAVQVGALASLGAAAVHSALDFNMQIPANALLIAACAGIAANPSPPRGGDPPAKRLPGWFFAGLAGACGLVLSALTVRDAPAAVLHLEIENALLSGAGAEAERLASAYLEREPADRDILLLRGRARLAISEASPTAAPTRFAMLALSDLDAADRVAPLDAYGEIARAMALGRLGDFTGSEESAARAVALFPNFHGTWDTLGLALEAQERGPEAIGIYAASATLPRSQSLHERLQEMIRRQKKP